MFVSLNTLSIDDLESWREVLNISLFAATLAVCVGVYLEKENNPESVKREGWSLVVWGISLEIICATGIWQIDSSISSRQRSEIISLETYLLPRVITEQQSTLLAKELTSPFKIEYAFTVSTDEDAVLAISLAAAFDKVGWKWIDWPAPPRVWFPYAKKWAGKGIMLSGIQIGTCNDALSETGKTLANSLKAIGLDGVRFDAADCTGVPPNNKLIEIMIGPKPRYIPPQ